MQDDNCTLSTQLRGYIDPAVVNGHARATFFFFAQSLDQTSFLQRIFCFYSVVCMLRYSSASRKVLEPLTPPILSVPRKLHTQRNLELASQKSTYRYVCGTPEYSGVYIYIFNVGCFNLYDLYFTRFFYLKFKIFKKNKKETTKAGKPTRHVFISILILFYYLLFIIIIT